MHFLRAESTLDSLKSVLSAFRRKPSLGAPDKNKNTLKMLPITIYIFADLKKTFPSLLTV